MKNPLKTKLEQVVSEVIEHLSKNGALIPKRIVLYFPENRSRNDTFKILSRVETHFLNQQFCIDRKIKVVNPYLYKQGISPKEGDCNVDVGFLLRRDEFREFLMKVATEYDRGFPAFEGWAEQYGGEYRDCLSRFVKCLEKRNSGGADRVLPSLGPSDIDSVLDEISYQLIF